MDEVPFGEWLKRQRSGRGLTQEQLAQQIGCATITLRKIESEHRRPSAQIIERMAEIFNIPQAEKIVFSRFARGGGSAPAIKSEAALWSASPSTSRSNLPASLTSFIGREQDIALVCEYLVNPSIRMVTLLGPPGIGKTRLSLSAAHEVLPNFPDGVFFVALAPLENASVVAPTILETLSLVESELKSPLDRLKEGIGDKNMLLVLDNLEHIIDGAASLASDLLSACPRLKVLTTSREALRVPGEWLYSVPVLNIPQKTQLQSMNMEEISKYAALRLFAERARAVQTDFVLNSENIQAVVAICTQLDGLPLAIELIAARIRMMSPQALLAKLNDQLVLSADGMRAVPARQKTLHNAINWSYNLLTPDEQNLFARLSVFSGGSTLDTAEAIFSPMASNRPVSDLITLLADKSLLQRTFDSRGELRFTMLVTIQKFALDRLRDFGEETEIRNRHLAYFLDFAEQADKHIHGPNQAHWLNLLEMELNNIRTALDWCISQQKTESALRLLGGLGEAWDVRCHHYEARSWFDKIRTLSDTKDYPVYYATLLNHLGHHNWVLGEMQEARTLLEESQEIWLSLGTAGQRGLAEAYRWLGGVARAGESDKNKARSYFEKSLELSQKNSDHHGEAVSLFLLSRISDSDDSALVLLEESLDLFQQIGDLFWSARLFKHFGWRSQRQGNFQKAHLYLNDYLAIYEEIGFKQGIMHGLLDMGRLFHQERHYDRAERYYHQSLHFSREYGLRRDEALAHYYLGILSLQRNGFMLAAQYFKQYYQLTHSVNEKLSASHLLHGLAAVSSGLNKLERAARLYGAMRGIGIFGTSPSSLWEHEKFNLHINIAREQLGEERFESFAIEGRAMTMEQAVAYALEPSFTQ